MFAKEENQEEDYMRENLEQIEDSDADESLSFCDLPIYDKASSTTTNWDGIDDDDDDRRRPSTDQELFEFFCDLNSEMCPADDIIFCGKLVSSHKEKQCDHHEEEEEEDKNTNLDSIDDVTDEDDGNQTCTIKNFFTRRRRRRSESLNGLQRTQSSAKDRLMRTNHSLDYRKLRRVSSSTKTLVDPIDRCISRKCSGKANSSSSSSSSFFKSSTPASARPKWLLLMFGMVNVPKEMELKDIKNRQNRRNPTLLFPEIVAGGGDTEKVRVRKEAEKGPWSLLRALSCSGHASAAVTTSWGCIPHV